MPIAYIEPDDSAWEYILVSKLMPYIECVKKWWSLYGKNEIESTGVSPMSFEDGTVVPPGIFIRTTSSARRSPIKYIQAFPFIPTRYLQIFKVPGGVCRMIERVCQRNIEIQGFKVIEKSNLPSTWHKGQFIALVPKDIYENTKNLGRYMYLSKNEILSISDGVLLDSTIRKCRRFKEGMQ